LILNVIPAAATKEIAMRLHKRTRRRDLNISLPKKNHPKHKRRNAGNKGPKSDSM